MLGQLTERFQSRSVMIATAGCVVALFFSVFSVGKAQAIWYENDQLTVDGDAPGVLVTFKQQPTALLTLGWAGPVCDKDVTGDGTSGSGGDRAMCALDLIWQNCPHGWWPPEDFVSGVTCTAITDHDEWDDIDGALNDVAGGNECLSVHLGSTESGPYNWTSRDISEDECS